MPAAANASPARLSVVVSLTRFPVSEYRPCFLPTVPRLGVSFPPLGSCGEVPQLRRYYETLRFPADRFAALRLCFAWRYHPVRLSSSLRQGPTPACGQELSGLATPTPDCCRGGAAGRPKFLGSLLRLCPVLR